MIPKTCIKKIICNQPIINPNTAIKTSNLFLNVPIKVILRFSLPTTQYIWDLFKSDTVEKRVDSESEDFPIQKPLFKSASFLEPPSLWDSHRPFNQNN